MLGALKTHTGDNGSGKTQRGTHMPSPFASVDEQHVQYSGCGREVHRLSKYAHGERNQEKLRLRAIWKLSARCEAINACVAPSTGNISQKFAKRAVLWVSQTRGQARLAGSR
ncbi:Uncharacterised protein [Actinobaculum suis]|uniref:Uncharacterized protein n=1 Tax=Actinobaculum suis TaxID=1657 RepID=A0A7Z8Y9T6_9ACTO|nr:Uncharacterised protein [Actinobaculum suis]